MHLNTAGVSAPRVSLVSAPARPKDRPWLIGAILFLTFCSTLFLYTRANRLPYQYHPDEPEKTAQVYRNYRNFRHPQLLLTMTEAAMQIAGTPREPQATAQVGRNVAATFA